MVLVALVEEGMMGSGVAFHSFPKYIAIVVVVVSGVVGVVVVEEVREEVGNSKIDDFDEQICC
jgi:hypothetical protein